ncbi:hypothetical protein POTOM_031269 [Populus tomentosa]|uniref:Uncharacterized protein n=1 Tax=Populus tomentosa TaxID=118781 RepID=A0A8X7Z740_POPTO|nr:hypothetical protein POTOM_031269 [Populus tomentosa]
MPVNTRLLASYVFPGSLGREIPIRGKLPVDDLVDIQGGLCGVLTPEIMVEKGLVGILLELSKRVSSHKPKHKRSILPIIPSRSGLVVSDCAKRWFQDTLKEAKTGDITMQVLVVLYCPNLFGCEFSILNDLHKLMFKGSDWMSRASKRRMSVWKVSDKRPGYNASDSDSDEVEDGRK